MEIEFLGTAGATTTPRPGCRCDICVEAREKGVPYSRTGPSVFVHGPNVLIDTPEESVQQLNRSRVREIAGCFYSHWHPDHVMGRRVWEALNADWRAWPPPPTPRTPIYLPQQVATDFRTRLATWDHLTFFAQQGWVELVELRDGDTVTLAGTRIRPFRLAEDYVYAFLFEAGGRRALIALDELNGWSPPADVRGVDLAVIPMGIHELDPFTGERRIAAQHPVLRTEATFAETLAIVDTLAAKRVVMSHIEEIDGLSHDDLERLAEQVGRNITFAHDTMLVEV